MAFGFFRIGISDWPLRWGGLEAGKVADGRKNVEGLDHRLRGFAGSGEAGMNDNERRAQGFLKERVLTPNGVLAQVPAVVTPEDDDGVVAQLQRIEPCEQPANHGISVGHACGVVLAHLNSKRRIGSRVAFPAVVFHELTRTMPGGFARGLLRM